jgi:alginate O-acetyltransferase complex protein AlgI
MLFNSNEFLLFLIAVLVVYYALSGLRARNIWLLLVSYAFYAAWDWRFLGLLLITTAVDYAAGRGIADSSAQNRRRWLLRAGLAVNLAILFFFKYFNFFIESAAQLLGAVGLNPSLPMLNIVLPVGISFYTFQSMAYKIDVYQGTQEAERDPLIMALFTAYFPQLTAGPIERATHMLPQFKARGFTTRDQIESGLLLILTGMFKKVVIADVAARLIDSRVFADPLAAPTGMVLIGVYLFALQIYGDFAGYSDIARGVSRLFGIELIVNFRQPYFAANIADFWRRWHISLSNWLRDYVFMPTSRSLLRRWGTSYSPLIQVTSHLLTMVISGLWHGANWTFVVWGLMHGIYLSIHRLLTYRKILPARLLSGRVGFIVSVVITFHLVLLAWIFFRAPSVAIAIQVLGRAVNDLGASQIRYLIGRPLALYAAMLGLDWLQLRLQGQMVIRPLPVLARSFLYVGLFYAVWIFWSGVRAPFIYAQF